MGDAATIVGMHLNLLSHFRHVCYGPRDYVGDGGILVAPGDTDALTDALLEVLLNEGAWAEMSHRALEQARRLSPEAVGEAFARLLHDVVSRPARRRAAG